MAQTGFTPILTYASNTATSVPAAGNLTNSANGSELAVNTADKRLFTKDSGGNVVEVGTNPSALTVAGNLTLSGGTANGVTYLNGSKVLTSGSALTFNGTDLALTTAGAIYRVPNAGGSLFDTGGNNGLYIQATPSAYLGFYASGSEQMRLTSTGLGIGTSTIPSGVKTVIASPNTAVNSRGNLYVYTTDTATADYGAQLALGGSFSGTSEAPFAAIAGRWVGGTTGYMQFSILNSGTVAEQMRLTSTGLGIGTTPGYKVDASGQVRALEGGTGSGDGGLIGSTASANGNAGVLFQTNATSRWNLTTAGTNGATLRVYNYALASTVATFDSSGNLGLGVTPNSGWANSKAFDIGSFGALSCDTATSGVVSVAFNAYATGASTWKYKAGGTAGLYQQTDAHKWFTAASGSTNGTISFTQAMTLDADGRLLLGYTSAGETTTPFQIDMATAANPYVTRFANTNTSTAAYCVSRWLQAASGSAVGVIGTGGSTAGNAAFQNNFVVGTQTSNALVFTTADTERARITSGGAFLVGTQNTGLQTARSMGFQVNAGCVQYISHSTADGSGDSYVEFGYNGTKIGSITQNGTTGVLYNTTSDRRLKENIVPAPNASNVIDAIEIVSYDWKSAPDEHVTYGVIAQDLHAVAPQAVLQGDDGDEIEKTWGVDYSKLVPMLIKEVQSLRARVAALEA